MRSVIYVFYCKWGRGGVMDLVYGSSPSSYMDCKVIFGDRVFPYSPVWGSFRPVLLSRRLRHWPRLWKLLLQFNHLQLSTRRLPVILFVSRFECPFISCCLLCGVPMVAGGGFSFICVRWHVNNLRLINCLLSIVLLLPPPWALR